MSVTDPIRVLLVDDDGDDCLILRDLLRDAEGDYRITCVSTFTAGLNALTESAQNVALIDWRLGPENGLDLLRDAREQGCEVPAILLTGIDLRGAISESDSRLVTGIVNKQGITSGGLERLIRDAVALGRDPKASDRRFSTNNRGRS